MIRMRKHAAERPKAGIGIFATYHDLGSTAPMFAFPAKRTLDAIWRCGRPETS
jgi:hypothetical protein